MTNLFFFSVLPYVSLFILVAGSIFRYFFQSYKVSSLSSQFLEQKGLFWGSNAFHWGIIVLFFGHLIAFLFPRGVIAWNSIPLRILILEITAFAFGLCTLFGLIVLIIRRLKYKRLNLLVSKMDIFVYLILLIQIISGIWIAYFNRWGSSWFASVITPYLYSIFKLSPDSVAIASMPFSVKLHIASAFIMIAMIPFSRFFHMIAFPFKYIWRSYQVVTWNWDKNKIRNSRDISVGKPPKNN